MPSVISAGDLLEFASTNSDFGFEMQVLKCLRDQGFACDHSGTYRDPVTGKIRQFDIRAYLERGGSQLALAVECKNIRPTSPLLLSAVPRNNTEAFHDLFVRRMAHGSTHFEVQSCTGDASVYKVGELVGKRTDQVSRNTSSRELQSNDEVAFDKWNQAVNSCQEMVVNGSLQMMHMMPNTNSPPPRRVIVPVLVVPTGRLWRLNYSSDGAILGSPHQVNRVAFFLNHSWPFPSTYGGTLIYRLSHVEVLTFDELAGIADSWSGAGGFFPH